MQQYITRTSQIILLMHYRIVCFSWRIFEIFENSVSFCLFFFFLVVTLIVKENLNLRFERVFPNAKKND